MNLFVHLTFVTYDWKLLYDKFLFVNNTEPYILANNLSLTDALHKLIQELVIIDAKWVAYKLIDFNKVDNDIYVYYAARIPDSIKIKQGEWIGLGELISGDTSYEKMGNRIVEISKVC